MIEILFIGNKFKQFLDNFKNDNNYKIDHIELIEEVVKQIEHNYNLNILILDYETPFDINFVIRLYELSKKYSFSILLTINKNSTDINIEKYIPYICSIIYFPFNKMEISSTIKLEYYKLKNKTSKKNNLSEQQYKSIINHLSEMIIKFDKNGKILFANNKICNFFDVKLEDFITKNINDFFYGAIINKIIAIIEDQNFTETHFFETIKLNHKELHLSFYIEKIFNSTNNKKEYQAIIKDITIQTLTKQQVRILLKGIENTDESIITTNNEGYIEYSNQAFSKKSGFSFKEIKGKHLNNFFSQEKNNKELFLSLWKTILSGKTWTGKLKSIKKNNSVFYENITISPILDENNQITNFISIHKDLSQILELEKKSRNSQKMEAIGRLAGGISHNFNNLLSIIIGYSELSLDIAKNNSEIYQNITQILAASERAKNIIKQILTFSNDYKVGIEPTLVVPEIKNSLKIMRPIIPSTVMIYKKFKSNLLVNANPNQIKQIIINLCSNSYYAMRNRGGLLQIEVNDIDSKDLPKTIDTKITSDYYVKIKISDTGYGISPEKINKIFDPYFTTKNDNKSSGLGLTTVLGILRKYNGFIQVSSKLNEGTTFYIYIPSTLPLKNNDYEKETDKNQNKKIIYIDDEKNITDSTNKFLTQKGYHVDTFSDSVKAFQHIKKNLTFYDIIITEQVIPKLTGLDLAKEIKNLNSELPVIICSKYCEEIIKIKDSDKYLDKVLSKPIDFTLLDTTIKKLLKEKDEKKIIIN